ncbi:hypothetical protein [Leifsonia virtsii]|uniref:LysM domain-containing protein n=1 Tax=Leifsonia virtsii TaxID=3035915 RepID=A0ABT8J0R1_9MICO|nr:hypothetical protein [Leifsonia virtsii]MDN4598659.1 hypothetical protein [Leifsonia virtsii]
MIRMGAGRIAAAMVMGVAGLILSACSLLPAQAARPTTAAPTETPSPVPLVDQLPQLLKKGQTIGTGDLQRIDHEPFDDPRAQHPPTGKVTIVVDSSGRIEVRLRLDDPAAAPTASTDFDIVLSTTRHDGLPDPTEYLTFSLVSDLGSATADGELILPLGGDEVSFGDPTFLHSVEVNVAGEGPVLAAAPITWTLPSPYPGLKAVDHGVATFAHGATTIEDGEITGYVPNPYDTVHMVSRRFGITEVQLLWLNPWMAGDPTQLKYGVPINLAASRR